MRAFKNCRLAMIFFGHGVLGDRSSGMRNNLPDSGSWRKNPAGLEKAEKALKECQSAKAAVEDSSRYSAEAAAKKCEDIFERITTS